MSSNPFRKAAGAQVGSQFAASDALHLDTMPASTLPPPKTSFRADDYDHGDDDEGSAADEAPGKKKVVKKVRVLSPPPLSPDSPEWPYMASSHMNPGGEAAIPRHRDPFGISVPDSDNATLSTPTATPPPVSREPPANPFSKTLRDPEGQKQEQIQEEVLENQRREEGAVLKAARGSINVDAFHRLLMTGDSGVGGHGRNPRVSNRADETQAVDTARDAEVAAVREKEETDGSESSSSTRPAKSKKPPPPPPSSRHGKAIKDREAQQKGPGGPGKTRRSLPPDPQTPTGETAPTPPAVASPGEQQSLPKKPVPAPPPRRTRGRPESKMYEPSAMSQALRGYEDEAPSRSSTESISRSNSARQSNKIPAPPPPRRQHMANRPSSQQASPTSSTFRDSHLAQDNLSSPPEAAKPPRPPPARNLSHRRPPSVSSIEASSRNVSSEIPRSALQSPPQPPPPPPSRKRESSKGSIDSTRRRVSSDRAPAAEEETGAGGSILADLDALRREVDALRGKAG